MASFDRTSRTLAAFIREYRLRLNHFGLLDDLRLGTMLGQLLSESVAPLSSVAASSPEAGCTDEGSSIA